MTHARFHSVKNAARKLRKVGVDPEIIRRMRQRENERKPLPPPTPTPGALRRV